MAKSIVVTDENIDTMIPLILLRKRSNGNRITLRLQGSKGREFRKDSQPYKRAVETILTDCVRRHNGAVTIAL